MLQELDVYYRLNLDVVAAEGCELILRDGRRVLDLYGGHCVNTLGAGDPALGAVIAEQWRRLSFVTNVLDHPPRHEFLSAFGALLPPLAGDEWRVFCTNSGAEANENAIKLALFATGRRKVLVFSGAFHGRTAGAAALTDGSHAFPAPPFDVARVPFGDTAAATRAIDGSVAAVLLEPYQSLAGVTEPPSGFLEALRAACDRQRAALIYDEVQTASGRLGTPFAAQHFGVVPDLITTAKGAAGGLPIGLTLVRASLVEGIARGYLGSTFGGGPLVLAAAAEVARRVASAEFQENVRRTSAALKKAVEGPPVVQIRGAGLLLGLVLEQGVTAAAVRDALLARDVLVGTCNDPQVVRLSPPLVLRPSQAVRLAQAMQTLRQKELVR
jgi:acetylornithine/succinyldiaminopimelate/putrescine aminotransferase